MPDTDMNALLRARGQVELPRAKGEPPPQPTPIETYRQLSVVAREHEWQNLTEEDRRLALAEGLQPSFVEPVAAKADGGKGGDKEFGLDDGTDINALLRQAAFGRRA